MSILEKIPHYSKDMPHKPIFDIDFQDEVHMAWDEKWGYNSTFGKLKKVLVYRPGDEQKDDLIQTDRQLFNLPEGPSDLEKMQTQHDNFTAAMKKEGIEVIYLNPPKPLIGTYGIPLRSAPFMRETITVPGGVIICRLAVAYKKGLEAFAARRVAQLGCPIMHTLHGRSVFEASNSVWVDEKSVILAIGPKKVISPAIGIPMNDELRKRGIDVIEVDLSEFAAAGGGPTCLTLPLIRE